MAVKLIEMGWNSYRQMVVPPNAIPEQIRQLRLAYYAGCQGLFTTLLTILDPGEEATPEDLKKIDAVAEELKAFSSEALADARRRSGGKQPN